MIVLTETGVVLTTETNMGIQASETLRAPRFCSWRQLIT